MSKDTLRKVLFIAADQWRADCLSLLDHPTVKTPNLDSLAADGTCFLNHFAQCAPCGPSRTSMLTGMYMMNHRSVCNGTPLDRRHGNLAWEARKAGYDPLVFGYTDTSMDPRRSHPADPALTRYEGIMPGFSIGMEFHELRMEPWLSQLRRKGHVLPKRPFEVYGPRPDYPGSAERGHSFAPPIYDAEDSDTAFLTDTILDYLSHHSEAAWFLHGVFLRPHPPLFAPEPYNALYDPDRIELPKRAASKAQEQAQHPYLARWIEDRERIGSYSGHDVNVVDLPDHEIRQMRASYYGLITEVDHHLGRIIDHLKATGEYDQTLIVFTVDHGEQLGDHWLFGKGGYFDQSFHIPLIIRDPRPQADAGRGRRIDAFTESVDLMPTILDWLGRRPPRQCDGASLLPFLQGNAPDDWRSEVHWEFDFRDLGLGGLKPELLSETCNLATIRGAKYKYVHFGGFEPLFFDLEADPGEFNNLAQDPAYQSLVLDYAQKMLSWRLRYNERTMTAQRLTRAGLVDAEAMP